MLESLPANANITFKTPNIKVEMISYMWDDKTSPLYISNDHVLTDIIAPSGLVSQVRMGKHKLVRAGKIRFVPAEIPSIPQHHAAGYVKAARCHISRELFDPLVGVDRQWDISSLRDFGNIRSSRLGYLLQRLIAEATAPGFASDILVDGLGIATRIELARYLNDAAFRKSKSSGGLAPWQMRHITEYVENCTGILYS